MSDNSDTQRLDWLIKQGPPGACDGVGLNDFAWDAAMQCVDDDLNTDKACIRAAIDEAMRDYVP